MGRYYGLILRQESRVFAREVLKSSGMVPGIGNPHLLEPSQLPGSGCPPLRMNRPIVSAHLPTLEEGNSSRNPASLLLSGAGHGLLNRLTSISLAAETAELALEKQQPAVALRGILRLQESIGSFQRMLQDLLLANRLIDSRQVLEITSWESSFFRQWTSQVLRSFSEADQGRLKLAVNGAAASMTDAAVIEPLLFHLLSNALKFSNPGTEVELRFDSTAHGLSITVTDSGIGIPPNEQARVGEPFFRASNVGGRGGLGLGAFIVRALVSLHGGRVSWNSCAISGTQVCVLLAPPEAQDVGTPLS